MKIEELERRVQELITQTMGLPPEKKLPVIKGWLRNQPSEARPLCTQLIELGLNTTHANAATPTQAAVVAPSASKHETRSAWTLGITVAGIGLVGAIGAAFIQSCGEDKDKKSPVAVNVTQVVSQVVAPLAPASPPGPPPSASSAQQAPSKKRP